MPVAAPAIANAAQAVAAARVALAEAMVLKVGQVLEALVVGKAADGATALKIGEHVVTARLPQLALTAGSVVQLQVKATGSAPQLQVLSVQPPAQAARPVATPPPAAVLPQAPGEPAAPASVPPQPQLPQPKAESTPAVAPRSSQPESAPARSQPAASTPPSASAEPVLRAEPTLRPPAASPAAQLQAAPPSTPEARPNPAAAPAATPAQPTQAEAGPLVRPLPSSPAQPAPPAPATTPPAPAAPPPSPMQPAPSAAAAGDPAEPAPNPLLLAQAAPRPPANVADLPRPAPIPGPPQAAPQPSAPPPTPQAALAQMLPDALGRQNSAGPLLASLAAAVQMPALLPEPVLRAALGVLAQRLVVRDGQVPAPALEQAVTRAGVTLEASLLRGEPQPRDAKAGLLALREALVKWLGGAPAPTAPVREPAPPPIRGLPLRAAPVDAPPLPDVARDAGRMLHEQADAAVSRLKLMQLASLPDSSDPARPVPPALRLELPFLVGHELVMAQMQIGPDGSRRERREGKRGWTLRFALDYSATGEVGAEVGVLGKAVTVSLWAAEPETAAAMQAALPELTGALDAAGLTPGAVKIRHGVPAAPPRPLAGRLLDSVS
ncbi:MAG: hypothetical protein BGO82_16370 [Devosia sp. 67-54]|uniref:flagellar hook-length control protein FliK n=1 Tax=unclassified Devosia TaxID=196773 RepID=UPI0009676307|nr:MULTISPECIES: flagellar hook-length control protein FliK [unclassified Devosia]MBN9303950.1 flagellar hook-length control protein FliK [Devosia sp.]OJX17795.1 MAG: hypothetical protein BGO82_16370 [Devosia sp. 67-54]